MEVKRGDLQTSYAINAEADKIMEAANLIINCMTELRPEIKSLANRNYQAIKMSANAVKQLVSNVLNVVQNQNFYFVSNCLLLIKYHYFLWKKIGVSFELLWVFMAHYVKYSLL